MAWQMSPNPPAIPAGMPLVCALIPHFGKISMEWAQVMYTPFASVPHPAFAKTLRVAKGLLNLDTERNELVRTALEDKNITHLLWIDSDIICEDPKDVNEAIRRLLATNVPIVSGLYRAKKAKGSYPYAMWARHPSASFGYIDIPQWTGNWLSVDAIGMGFCLCKREVFEKIPPPWFVWDKVAPSEDFDWCQKVRNAGYEIKVYTDVRLSHEMSGKVLCNSGDVHVLDV